MLKGVVYVHIEKDWFKVLLLKCATSEMSMGDVRPEARTKKDARWFVSL